MRRAVVDFLDGELDRLGLRPERLVLAGFSQGGITALHVGLRHRAKLGGIVAYAGFLPGGEPVERLNGTPVTLVHGEKDPVVPVFASVQTAEALKRAGVPVALHRLADTGHVVSEVGLGIARQVLRKTMAQSET